MKVWCKGCNFHGRVIPMTSSIAKTYLLTIRPTFVFHIGPPGGGGGGGGVIDRSTRNGSHFSQ